METTIPGRIERSIYAVPYSGRFQTTTVMAGSWLVTKCYLQLPVSPGFSPGSLFIIPQVAGQTITSMLTNSTILQSLTHSPEKSKSHYVNNVFEREVRSVRHDARSLKHFVSRQATSISN